MTLYLISLAYMLIYVSITIYDYFQGNKPSKEIEEIPSTKSFQAVQIDHDSETNSITWKVEN